ncbi:MAG: PaaI family thioesterase [Syntrophomonadaceae bacterium]|nr:PaaI family thioesterase [Syntrophomonadaceae bacterium]MDD3023888.1 PaaI family thioesterase [Syntrophomonadaceae bacterium]
MINHYRGLERMYLLAPYNQQLYDQTTISVSEGQAVITTLVNKRHFHGAGSMHGSCYFRMLDDAAFFAVNSLVSDYMVYTASFELKLTRPVSGGIIKSVGKIKHCSEKMYIAEAILYDEQERVCALGTGKFMKSNILVNEIPGYLK